MRTVITYQELLAILYVSGIYARCITDLRVYWGWRALMCHTREEWSAS